ncbi:uncharacterized protein A4U43_C03F2960 [Asparagus officinalis]|uniref:Coatomer alpha subunit C-terminal domain-containing protein n=1 Tax=Asparagus officinalis TaxID=4686 RepID=A0A5P1F6Y4_ASPOF|nr:uncharacterized protein A4U43_C03F2960 [Asparagus officinalis]
MHIRGIEALRQGNTSIVEYAYQKINNFERLSFLYLITGNKDKLPKMLRIADMKIDVVGPFHNAMYLPAVEECVKILENAGDLPLAYFTASTHGLIEVADRLAAELEQKGITLSLPEGKARSLLMPPASLMCSGDWPLFRALRGIFYGGLDTVGRAGPGEEDEAADAEWGHDDLDIVNVDGAIQDAEVNEIEANGENDEEGGWDLEDLEVPADMDSPRISTNTRTSVFVAPTPGVSVSQIWIQ